MGKFRVGDTVRVKGSTYRWLIGQTGEVVGHTSYGTNHVKFPPDLMAKMGAYAQEKVYHSMRSDLLELAEQDPFREAVQEYIRRELPA